MGTNVNLSDVLKKIASDAGFISSAGDKFKQGESLEVLFVSGSGSNKLDSLVLKDTSGDNYSISAQSLQGFLSDDEYNALINGGTAQKVDTSEVANSTQIVLGSTVENVNNTTPVDATTNVEATVATQGSEAIKQEIEQLQLQREVNQQSMESLKSQIEDLREIIEQSIADALDKMEEIEEEQKKKAEEVVAQELKKYKESNGEMSQDEFSANVKSALAAINPSMGDAISDLMTADNNMALMSNLLGQLNQKIDIDKQLASQIDTKQTAYDEALAAEEAAKKAAEEAAKASSCECPDPIGANFGESLDFDLDGDGDAGQIQIDFFYDEDGDGKINSLDDFVGAKADAAGGDGWDEMSVMDLDGDGTITDDEMAQSGVKVMVTEIDDDGTKSQRAMTMDEFTEQVGKGDLEISAQKHDEIDTNVTGPFGFSDNENNELLGTFDIGFSDDESVDTVGYQTRDDAGWLVENYADNMDIENLKAQGVDVSAVEGTQAATETNEIAAQYEQFSKQYAEEVIPQLQQQIVEAYSELGLSQEAIEVFKDLAEATAEVEGAKIADEIEAKEKEALEEAESAEEAEESEETEETEDDSVTTDETLEVPDAEIADTTADETVAEEVEQELLIDEEPDEMF